VIRYALLAFTVAATPAGANQISGHPRVIDGDTLAFCDAHVRMIGIDAPEKAQTCQDQTGAGLSLRHQRRGGAHRQDRRRQRPM